MTLINYGTYYTHISILPEMVWLSQACIYMCAYCVFVFLCLSVSLSPLHPSLSLSPISHPPSLSMCVCVLVYNNIHSTSKKEWNEIWKCDRSNSLRDEAHKHNWTFSPKSFSINKHGKQSYWGRKQSSLIHTWPTKLHALLSICWQRLVKMPTLYPFVTFICHTSCSHFTLIPFWHWLYRNCFLFLL